TVLPRPRGRVASDSRQRSGPQPRQAHRRSARRLGDGDERGRQRQLVLSHAPGRCGSLRRGHDFARRSAFVMPPRLLLVEDEPGLQLALTDRLTAEGYTVETAGDGDTAVTRAKGEPFDVIVLDVMLPGRDGFEVAKTIRQHGLRTPILMLTARSQVVDRV